jgi:hypothetical protein
MDIKKYLAALQVKESTQQANFGKDADTVLGMLCNTYYELNCNADTDEVKQAFDELYQAMSGKTLKEKDEVIYATCRLCSLHQQTGFIDGIKLGLQLARELNN